MAEAAALLAAGVGGELVLSKRVHGGVTIALARSDHGAGGEGRSGTAMALRQGRG
ncbi:hypothetical protein GCM10010168_32850 [Actinoplanes ianthinogenes]|uniref:CobE/GbiG C-terminal domain-containing protein n=1 Tax=Actinoplanes ianthinogenes TaxID=122358 RepID=A0ABN6C4K9_9ACTN|nr:hypothetical protein Aiant_10820 [Actinoplanes ianthinogenes]GGR12191.1 hypothetical protein GCM10010168_32850 [Actinoplanes ianthinogenes]